MAVVQNFQKRQAYARLATGTSASGTTTYTNVSLGTLSSNESAWDGDKAIAILSALSPVFNHDITALPMTVTYNVQQQ